MVLARADAAGLVAVTAIGYRGPGRSGQANLPALAIPVCADSELRRSHLPARGRRATQRRFTAAFIKPFTCLLSGVSQACRLGWRGKGRLSFTGELA